MDSGGRGRTSPGLPASTGSRARAYHHRGGEQPLLGCTLDAHFRAIVAAHATRDHRGAQPREGPGAELRHKTRSGTPFC